MSDGTSETIQSLREQLRGAEERIEQLEQAGNELAEALDRLAYRRKHPEVAQFVDHGCYDAVSRWHATRRR